MKMYLFIESQQQTGKKLFQRSPSTQAR